MNQQEALMVVLGELGRDPKSDFAKQAFLEVLRLLPPVPHVPGSEVFFELARKMVPNAVELILVRDGKVYLTYRADEFFIGWHLPGTYREPSTPFIKVPLITDALRCAKKELGPNVMITSARKIGWEEHPESSRFHDAGILTFCEFMGEPKGGQWFSECPSDLIPVHLKYWPTVERALRGEA